MIFLIRIFLLALAALDHFFSGIPKLFLKSQYVRVGACNRCGKCCEALGFEMQAPRKQKEFWKKVSIYWVEKIHHMQWTGEEDDVLIFKCKFLTQEGTCGIYKWRPFFCRIYPEVKNFFLKPIYLNECSYRSILRKDYQAFQKQPEKFLDTEALKAWREFG